jgi:hypothetical protein
VETSVKPTAHGHVAGLFNVERPVDPPNINQRSVSFIVVPIAGTNFLGVIDERHAPSSRRLS